MADTELQITFAGDKFQALRSLGGGLTGDLRLSALDRDLIRLLDRLVREKRLSHHSEFEIFGSLLYEALFGGELDRFLRQSLERLEGTDCLRLQLVFDEASYVLARFPWEFLYANGRGARSSFFLATLPRLILSRYLPMYEDRPDPPSAAKPLRLLVIISRPEDPALGTVIARPVADAIKSLEQPGSIEVLVLENAPPGAVLNAVENGCPHIIHYIGHGMYDEKENEGHLAFVADDGKTAQWIPETTFAAFFDAWQPHLAFLQACEGAAADFTNNFAGLAPKLIGKNIAAVVAMQYPVSNDIATNFSLAFYNELMQGTPYDHAVQSGRRRILLLNPKALDTRDFATPVLYMRSRDGRIWPQVSEVK